MAKRDYYEILGVGKGASKEEMKKSYRKIAMKFHPDRNEGDTAAEDKFKEAAEAYEVLSDDDKRARYDRFGHAGVGGASGGGGYSGNMSMDDIFSQFGDIFGDSPFGSMFGGAAGGRGGGRARRQQGHRGNNLRIKVKLSLDEIHKGVNKKIKVKKYVGCKTCNNSGAKDSGSVSSCGSCGGAGYVRKVSNTFLGQMQTTAACPACSGQGTVITAKCSGCKGEGRLYGDETINIDIPAGVSEGMQLSMSGKGNIGMRGGPSGDLLINIEEVPHDDLQRDGTNLIHELFVNFADAALGTGLEVPTIDGMVKIKLPAGTQAGKIFRLRGKGLPSVQGYGAGDQLIHVNIWTPKSLSAEEKKILEKLRESKNFIPSPSKSEKGFFDKMRDYFN